MPPRGRSGKGKMPVTRDRGRTVRPVNLVVKGQRKRRNRQSTDQPTAPDQPTPPIQPTPPVQPVTRRRGRIIQPVDLVVKGQRRRSHRKSTNQPTTPVQPTPPVQLVTKGRGRTKRPSNLAVKGQRRSSRRQSLAQPTPPVQPTLEAFSMIPTTRSVPFRALEGEPSHRYTLDPQAGQTVAHQPQVEEEDEVEEEEPPQDSIPHELDVDGKVIIRPYARGWTPSSAAADAIKSAIRTQFRGPYHCWSATPEDVRDYWWKCFGEKVSWDPCDHGYIRKTFQQKCAKRLSDMLSKVRKKGTRPHWIEEEAWSSLIVVWDSDDFKKVSSQNKINRASSKGGAVHTTGRTAHIDVALRMAQELGRSVDPAEFFKTTHTKKSGDWVDDRSQSTYKQYHCRLTEAQTQIGNSSTSGTQEIDGETKLELWKEVAGGKKRGRCYGTADLSSNLRRGVSSLTQESLAPFGTSGWPEQAAENAVLRQEVSAARQEAAKANKRYLHLKKQFRTMMDRMTALEHESLDASTSASQTHKGDSDYDVDLDDHSLDEGSPDRRRRRL